jgi:predicted nucleic acid-binding protein
VAELLALLDSNVIVATVAEAHEHHIPSIALFREHGSANYCVAAHSYAEAFTTLTRRGDRAPFRWPADEAWAALESIAAVTTLVGMTPPQGLDAVRSYAEIGGIGARIYDYLIGRAAIVAGASSLVTWNVGQFRDLFPDRLVETPVTYAARTSAH